jgi:hypothetical protein
LVAVTIIDKAESILPAFASLGAICSIVVDRCKVDMMFTFRI